MTFRAVELPGHLVSSDDVPDGTVVWAQPVWTVRPGRVGQGTATSGDTYVAAPVSATFASGTARWEKLLTTPVGGMTYSFWIPAYRLTWTGVQLAEGAGTLTLDIDTLGGDAVLTTVGPSDFRADNEPEQGEVYAVVDGDTGTWIDPSTEAGNDAVARAAAAAAQAAAAAAQAAADTKVASVAGTAPITVAGTATAPVVTLAAGPDLITKLDEVLAEGSNVTITVTGTGDAQRLTIAAAGGGGGDDAAPWAEQGNSDQIPPAKQGGTPTGSFDFLTNDDEAESVWVAGNDAIRRAQGWNPAHHNRIVHTDSVGRLSLNPRLDGDRIAATTSGGLLRALAASGTPEREYLRGDGTWQVPPGGGTGTNVEANPGGSGLTNLRTITIGSTDYAVAGDYDDLSDIPIHRVADEGSIPAPSAATLGRRYQTDDGQEYLIIRVTVAGVDRVVEFEDYPTDSRGYQGAVNSRPASFTMADAGKWWLVRDAVDAGNAPFVRVDASGVLQSISHVPDAGHNLIHPHGHDFYASSGAAMADARVDAMSAVIYSSTDGAADWNLFRVVAATFVAGNPTRDDYVIAGTDLPPDLPNRVRTLERDADNVAGTAVEMALTVGTTTGTILNASGAAVSVEHGLDGKPVHIEVYLECVVADKGYSVGDRIHEPTLYWVGECWSDATHVGIVARSGQGTTGPDLNMTNKGGTRARTKVTNGSWKLVAVPYGTPA